jgi:Ni,Fe-hydrogenase III small subunit
MVDSLLSDRPLTRQRGRMHQWGLAPVVHFVECSSPRQADVVVVTGEWNEEVAGPALAVLDQAPAASKLVVVGDCALGQGPFALRLKTTGSIVDDAQPDLEIAGCPVAVDLLGEEMSNVTR